MEHATSTGIRDPVPNAAKFDEFASFADEDGRFYMPQIAKAVRHFRKNPNDINTKAPAPAGIAMLGGFTNMLLVWGRGGLDEPKGTYLTTDDMRGLMMEGRYPAGWVPRTWSQKIVGSQMMRFHLCSILGILWDVIVGSKPKQVYPAPHPPEP